MNNAQERHSDGPVSSLSQKGEPERAPPRVEVYVEKVQRLVEAESGV